MQLIFYVRNALQTDLRRFAKNVILEVTTSFLEYIFFCFSTKSVFFKVNDSLLNVEGAEEKDYPTYRHCRRDNLVQTFKIWLFSASTSVNDLIFLLKTIFWQVFFHKGYLRGQSWFFISGQSGGGFDIKLIFWTI